MPHLHPFPRYCRSQERYLILERRWLWSFLVLAFSLKGHWSQLMLFGPFKKNCRRIISLSIHRSNYGDSLLSPTECLQYEFIVFSPAILWISCSVFWVGKPQALREQLLLAGSRARFWLRVWLLFPLLTLTHAFVCQVARLGRCGLSSQ